MKKLTCALALTGIALTTIVGASPALAASAPTASTTPSASNPANTGVHVKQQFRHFDQHVYVSYILAGGLPGTDVALVNHTTDEPAADQTFDENGEAVIYNVAMKPGVVNDVRLHVPVPGGAWGDEDQVRLPFDDTRKNFDAPSAKVTDTANGKTHVEFTGTPNAFIRLGEAGKHALGGLLDLDKDGHASFDFDTPDHEVHYDVYQYYEGVHSAPGQLTLSEGVGTPSPEAPTADVTGTTTKGDAVVTVEGAAGNSTTVRNKEGKVVAIKMIGKNGKTQLTVPKDDTYVVRQAHGTESISKADSFVID